MAYEPLPYYPFAARTSPIPLAELDADLLYLSQKLISVKDYGALGDNVNDDTIAIQAAIDAAEAAGRGTVYFPTGLYKVTATLTVTGNNIALVGQSPFNSRLISYGDYGDVIRFQSTSPGTYLQFMSVSNLMIYIGENRTSGAALHLNCISFGTFNNLALVGALGSLLLDSCFHSYFSNIHLIGNSFYPAQKPGSYSLKVNQATGAMSSELHFSNCDFKGDSDNFQQYAVWLQEVDGIWFTDLHCGFCYDSAFAIIPNSDTANVVAVCGNNVYCDTADLYGLYIKENSATQTASANVIFEGFLSFDCLDGIHVDHRQASLMIMNAVMIQLNRHGVNLVRCLDSNISTTRLTDPNRLGATGYGVLVGANVNGLNLADVYVRADAFTPTAGIFLTNGCSNIKIAGATFEGCTTDIGTSAVADTTWQITDVKSDKSIQTISADAGGILTPLLGHDVFNLGTANNVTSIAAGYGWLGRRITLFSTGVVTIQDGNNIGLNNNNNMYVVNSTQSLTLLHNGTNWIEVARTPPGEARTMNPAPALAFGGSSVGITYSNQAGSYQRIGDWVDFTLILSLTNKGAQVGNATIENLPFLSRNSIDSYSTVALDIANITFADVPQGRILPNTNNITLREVTNAGIATNLTDADFNNSSVVIASGRYRAA